MRLGTSGPVSSPAVGNSLVLGLIVVVAAYALSQGLTRVSFTFAAGALFAVTMFGLVFLRSDWGIYLVIVSMLLSPEFGAGGSGENMRGSGRARLRKPVGARRRDRHVRRLQQRLRDRMRRNPDANGRSAGRDGVRH